MKETHEKDLDLSGGIMQLEIVDIPIISNSKSISLPQELLIFTGIMEPFREVPPTHKTSPITTIFEKKENNSNFIRPHSFLMF